MAFTSFGLHPDLLRGVKELGFTRPTPIQERRHSARARGPRPPRLRDDGQRQDRRVPPADPAPPHRQAARHDARARPHADARARRADRTSTSSELAVHTPLTGAAVFGGVGMGPQEHAFRERRRRDRRDARPAARPLPLRRTRSSPASRSSSSTRRTGCSTWASSRTSAASCRHLPARRQTLFFSRDDAAADRGAVAGDAARPGHGQPRAEGGARRRHHAGRLPGPAGAEVRRCSSTLLERGDIARACSSSRARSTAPTGSRTSSTRHGVALRAHPRQPQPGAAHGGARRASRTGKFRVLVATDIAARGIDVEALGHVVNFDVPHVPEDYIHRVGRTARAELTGRRLHVRLARRGGGPPRHRARDRQAAPARHGPGLRLRDAARGALRGPDRRAHRRDPRAQGRGAEAREGEGGPPRDPRGGDGGTAGARRASARAPGSRYPRGMAAPRRPQSHGPRRDGHVQGPARPGHHRPPQS